MIKFLLSFLLIGCYSQTLYAQKQDSDLDNVSIPESSCGSVDDLSSYIKQNFVADTSRIRAIYVWIANNISYDVARFEEMKKNPNIPSQTVGGVLKLRTAVCQGYSELFTALCKNVGINAQVISGYVKIEGKIMPVSHAWVAAEFNGEWFLFDPTWGAGYVNNNQFVKRFTNKFYKQYPKDIISDHMPFDPLFQFLPSPISNKEFIDGTVTGRKVLFNYKDSLLQYNNLSSTQQMAAALRRMEVAGIENDLLQQRREYLKKGLQSYASQNAFEDANKLFSRAISLLNDYFGKKNKQFSTVGDNDLLVQLDSMKYYIKLARSFLSDAKFQNDEQQRAKTGNLVSMDRYWTQLDQEDQFVKKYISTDKLLRKQLFIKR